MKLITSLLSHNLYRRSIFNFSVSLSFSRTLSKYHHIVYIHVISSEEMLWSKTDISKCVIWKRVDGMKSEKYPTSLLISIGCVWCWMWMNEMRRAAKLEKKVAATQAKQIQKEEHTNKREEKQKKRNTPERYIFMFC